MDANHFAKSHYGSRETEIMYTDEFLKPGNEIAHASELYSAGNVQAVFDCVREDKSAFNSIMTILSFPFYVVSLPFLIKQLIRWKKENPKKRFFSLNYDENLNKLMFFNQWLVRCTCQCYFDPEKQAMHFYYSGMPLENIKSVSITNDSLSIYGGSNFGGSMPIHKNDSAAITALFYELKQQGRLHPEAEIRVDK